MLYFQADPRDGGPSGAVCHACCCETLSLRPGETNLMTINYAPWSLPIGHPGIMPGGFEVDFEINRDACATGDIDGFGPPASADTFDTTAVSTAVTIDLAEFASPTGNTFTYEIVPLTGPYNGRLTGSPTGGSITYTPTNGWVGYDSFKFRTTDAQGRSVIRTAVITVGSPVGARPAALTRRTPWVDMTKINVNQRMQETRFPITMPVSAQPCERWRMTVKQNATDCDGTVYQHLACFDLYAKECG